MPNVSRGVTELLEVCVEDTKAIGVEEDFLCVEDTEAIEVEEDFLSASIESDIMTCLGLVEGEADGLNTVDELDGTEASVVGDTNTGKLVATLLVAGLVTGEADSVEDTIGSEATVGRLEVPLEVDEVDVIGTTEAVVEDTNGSEALVVPTSEIGKLLVLLEVCVEDVDNDVAMNATVTSDIVT